MAVINPPIVAGIDAGGTSFKLGIATADGTLLAHDRVATTTPEATITAVATLIKTMVADQSGMLTGLGIAAFGPLDIDPGSKTYGSILKTTKPGWSDVDLRRRFATALGVDVAVDTDVNGALRAEMKWGAAQDTPSAAYITIGTGIGAGIYAGGDYLGRPSHPEFGHIRIQRHRDDLNFAGVCPFHGDCLEGLASANAIWERFGDPQAMAPDHPGWEIEAFYLAQACLSLTLLCRPEKIILGGGLMQAQHLLGLVHDHYSTLMNGYLELRDEAVQELIVRPGLKDQAGLMGGVALALTL